MPPDRQPPEVLLADYEARSALLADLGQVVEAVLKGLLYAASLQPHSVTHRVKTKTSVERKLSDKDEGYENLDDMHDILGVRVITFFPDEVDIVADIVTDEFQIDRKNSEDKRKKHAPEEFGYMSVHYVASLNKARAKLTENARFAGLPFEIQIRSILQHAWAEIEHDLGYKTERGIPSDSRRRFSQLAGTLEMIDGQFRSIRDELAEYRRELPEAIKRKPSTVEINRDSILALATSKNVVTALDPRLDREGTGPPVPPKPKVAEHWARCLHAAGFESIEDVVNRVESNADAISRFVEEWDKRFPRRRRLNGAALFFVAVMDVASSESLERAQKFSSDVGFPQDDLATKMLEIWRATNEK